MSERVKWIDYKGKRMLFVDLENIGIEDFLPIMDEYIKELSAHANEIIRNLFYMPKFKKSLKINKKGKEVMRFLNKNNIDTASAVVGIKSWQKSIASLIVGNRKLGFFNTVEEAKDWLVDQ